MQTVLVMLRQFEMLMMMAVLGLSMDCATVCAVLEICGTNEPKH